MGIRSVNASALDDDEGYIRVVFDHLIYKRGEGLEDVDPSLLERAEIEAKQAARRKFRVEDVEADAVDVKHGMEVIFKVSVSS